MANLISDLPNYSRRSWLTALAAAGGASVCSAGETGAYEREMERSRVQIGEQFKSANGPLTLVARFSPREGTSSFGRDAECALVLPDESAPARIGDVTVQGGKAVLRFASNIQATAGGKAVSLIEAD